MNRLDSVINAAVEREEKVLAAYFVAGDPNSEQAVEIFQSAAANGADILELGVPFSDPMVDGEEIRLGHARALRACDAALGGLDLALANTSELRGRGCQVPIVLMGYLNTFIQAESAEFDWSKTVRACHKAGVDGLIIVDAPMDVEDDLWVQCTKVGMSLIYLVTPTTSSERLERIAAKGTGYIYAVSYAGTTGLKRASLEDVRKSVESIKRVTETPTMIGFGIKDAATAAEFAPVADGLIVGTELVTRVRQGIDNNSSTQSICENIGTLIQDIKSGMASSPAGK